MCLWKWNSRCCLKASPLRAAVISRDDRSEGSSRTDCITGPRTARHIGSTLVFLRLMYSTKLNSTGHNTITCFASLFQIGMPLYGRKFFHLDRDENDATSFTVEHTQEKFHQQTVYEQVLKVYALERWTCQCTWRASLTHEQAYRSEIETRRSLPSLVPTYLHKPIFDIVHHSKSDG